MSPDPDEAAREVADALNRLLDRIPYDDRPPYPGHGWIDPDRLDRWDAAPVYADRSLR